MCRDLRRGGLGQRLAVLAEREAPELGYRRMYLHAHTAAPVTIGFWRDRGYGEIGAIDDHTEFDKPLRAA